MYYSIDLQLLSRPAETSMSCRTELSDESFEECENSESFAGIIRGRLRQNTTASYLSHSTANALNQRTFQLPPNVGKPHSKAFSILKSPL
mmetsp:Transcript_12649/g.33486  ORF Transcript_12649/g.33486 Transcript_12649/m.33486 type:complete len:90 (+) Transcript_12649:81-350(+)